VTEAYQRSSLIGFSSACGSGVLVPLKAWDCPSETAALYLPACHSSLALGKWCEADSEASRKLKYGIAWLSINIGCWYSSDMI